MANVGGAYNAVYVRGNCVGDVMLYGQGAGSLPTASAVVSDIMNVIQHINTEMTGKRPYLWHETAVKDAAENKAPYYIRLIAANAPGVLANMSGVLQSTASVFGHLFKRMKLRKRLKS